MAPCKLPSKVAAQCQAARSPTPVRHTTPTHSPHKPDHHMESVCFCVYFKALRVRPLLRIQGWTGMSQLITHKLLNSTNNDAISLGFLIHTPGSHDHGPGDVRKTQSTQKEKLQGPDQSVHGFRDGAQGFHALKRHEKQPTGARVIHSVDASTLTCRSSQTRSALCVYTFQASQKRPPQCRLLVAGSMQVSFRRNERFLCHAPTSNPLPSLLHSMSDHSASPIDWYSA